MKEIETKGALLFSSTDDQSSIRRPHMFLNSGRRASSVGALI